MIWLLDVSTLVAHLVQSHEHHSRVNAWWPGRSLAVCPITELGFLRVACALGSTMEDARKVLAEFLRDESPDFIPCDRRALDSAAITSPRKSTDIYLADPRHRARLATGHARCRHLAPSRRPHSRTRVSAASHTQGKGIVVILAPHILTENCGNAFLRALPKCPMEVV